MFEAVNYYNEFDPLKAEVLREAIKAGAIAPGHVDERSIKDVNSSELLGYAQCHFFAGGGFWSLALRLAGVPDWWPVWTGSCPCPSFSAAGKGTGFDDPRHLWPDWARLIGECKPPVIFGEQADDAVGYGWVDLVQTDLEATAYAFGKVVFGAHSVGAPHIRQRLYFAADTERDGGWSDITRRTSEGGTAHGRHSSTGNMPHSDADGLGTPAGGELHHHEHHAQPCGIAGVGPDAASLGHDGRRSGKAGDGEDAAERSSLEFQSQRHGDAGRGENPSSLGRGARGSSEPGHKSGDALAEHRSELGGGHHPFSAGLQGHSGDVRDWRGPGWLDPQQARSIAETGATRGFWGDCDWWYGRDGKYRPIGPGIQPLAHGSPARVGRLRLYGDGIVVSQATEFIKAYCEARGVRI